MSPQGTGVLLLSFILSLQHIHGYDNPGVQLPTLGKILVSEGSNGTDVLVSSELYSPLLNMWTAAGKQRVPRTGLTRNPNNADHAQAVRLKDGKALSFGGLDPNTLQPLASCEAYSMLTNSWTPCASLLEPRNIFQAVLLHDGRVLAIGGIGPNNTFLSSTELYTAGAWAPAGALTEGRAAFLAVVLHDGRVLVAGGAVASGVGNSVEVYNTLNNTWTVAAPMSGPHGGGQAVVLTNGSVLVVGGIGYAGSLYASAELYDPAENTWTVVTGMKAKRVQFQAVLLLDGRVLVMGGFDDDEVSLSSCEVYDPTSNTWAPAADMTAKRGAFRAVLLKDGSVMAIGGAAAHFDAPATASVEIYDVQKNAWHAVAPLSTARVGMQALVL